MRLQKEGAYAHYHMQLFQIIKTRTEQFTVYMGIIKTIIIIQTWLAKNTIVAI